ncbi:MAG TPA: hypothetical protein VIM75_09785 [Ohtaekwangia sp.]|uniref:hypothetical protein n=1 Tax=Ohtaekwangia sp. TaxID=2066019 RepID=UPI002F93B114
MSAIITSKLPQRGTLQKKATKEFRKHTAGKQRERLHYSNTLTFYNITPTPLRCQVLEAIYATTVTFSVQELLTLLHAKNKKITRSSLVAMLRFYTSKGLLFKIRKGSHTGKTVTKFVLSGKHILATV